MKKFIIIIWLSCAWNLLHAAFPIVAVKPKITHEEAYRIVISEGTGKEFKGTYIEGIIPREISYTCLEHSNTLRQRIETAPEEAKNELEKKLNQWGWLITISGFESLEHATAYFVTSQHECLWIYTTD